MSSNTIAKLLLQGMWMCLQLAIAGDIHIYKYKIAIAAWEAGKHPGVHCSFASIGMSS